VTTPSSLPDGLVEAYVDESMTQRGRRFYVLAAAVVAAQHVAKLEAELRDLRVGRETKLHWRAEDQRRRRRIVSAVAEMPIASIVVVGSAMDREERARRQCMESLLPLLQHAGVRRVWRETRTPTQDRLDREHVAAMVGRKFIPSTFRVASLHPAEHPVLWLPDIIAGAVNAAEHGDHQHLDVLRARVDLVRIELR
jgi:hypothetical protein